MDLYQKIKTVPSNPGVYLYKNAEGEVIYVGKAKNLRARVRCYFVEGAARTPRPAACSAKPWILSTLSSATSAKLWP